MNEIETFLITNLASLMKVEPDTLSLTMTFDEQGVDSLVGLRFIKKIHKATGMEIEMKKIFDYPTLKDLAQFLDAQGAVIKQ
jgi:acyl carrier protein